LQNLHLLQTTLSINDLYDALEQIDIMHSWAEAHAQDLKGDP
jgi:hypothetical protein